jgi:hypothetical protein
MFQIITGGPQQLKTIDRGFSLRHLKERASGD